MLPITLTAILMAIIISRSVSSPASSSKFISEFALDELTNADASYQPFNFAPHSRPISLIGAQLQSQQQQQHPGNRVQLLGKSAVHLHDIPAIGTQLTSILFNLTHLDFRASAR